MKILIAEDDQKVNDFLKASLEAEFFTIDQAFDGDRGSFLALTNKYDLLIIDYWLPEKNGDEIIKAVRADGQTVPILMLTTNTEPETKLYMFKIGIDDYVHKPFSMAEILARVKALLRRSPIMEEEVLKFNDLTMDTEKHLVFRGKNKIYLTFREFSLLEYLLRNQGKVLSRANILEHVWDMNADAFSNTIEAHILKLRKKINLNKRPNLIHNISGRGYKIDNKK